MKSFLCYTVPFTGDKVREVTVLCVDAVDEDHAEELVWNECEDVMEILKIEEVEDEEGD